jgi:hypothetical protein
MIFCCKFPHQISSIYLSLIHPILKLLLLVFPFLLFAASCTQEKEANEYKKNNVASKTAWDYAYENGVAVGEGKKSQEVTYNEEGEELKQTGFTSEGKIYYTSINHYNNNNQLIASELIVPAPYEQHGVDSFFYKDDRKILGKHYNPFRMEFKQWPTIITMTTTM